MMELYYSPNGPPSRAVRLTAEYIGISFKLNFIDVFKGEHLTPEFEKVNVTVCLRISKMIFL